MRPNDPVNRGKIKEATINKEIKTLKAMLNRAVDLQIIMFSPLKALKSLQELDSKVPEHFTPKEMNQIYKLSFKPHWWMLLANTGMRASEARNMLWSWVGEHTIMIESTAQQRTKSGKWREIPLTDNVKAALAAFKRELSGDDDVAYIPRPSDPVFPVITRHHFSRLASQDIARAGLKGSAHKFRHTYCSNHLMNGTNPGVVQMLAGHSDIKTTNNYMQMDSEFVAKLNVNI